MNEIDSRPVGDGTRSASAGSPLESLRILSLIAEEGLRLREALHHAMPEPTTSAAHASPAAPGAADTVDAPGPARDDGADAVLELMRSAQRLLLTHPVAAQKAFAALIAEGRAYAETDAGRQWVAALRSSQVLRKGRRMWSAMTFDMLEEQPSGALPSAYLELLLAFARASESELDDWAEALNGQVWGSSV